MAILGNFESSLGHENNESFLIPIIMHLPRRLIAPLLIPLYNQHGLVPFALASASLLCTIQPRPHRTAKVQVPFHDFRIKLKTPICLARSLNDLPSLSSPRKRLKEAGRSSTCDDPTVSTTRANLSNNSVGGLKRVFLVFVLIVLQPGTGGQLT